MAERIALDITTDDATTERPVVKIDSIGYPLRTSRDLSLNDFKSLERGSLRIGHLLQRDTLTKAEDLELADRLKGIAKMALDAPAAVLAKLTPIQRVLIFKVFTELLTPGLVLATRAIQLPGPSHGTKRSRASSGSMAGRRRHG